MIKKIAILALTAVAVFSNAFALESDCEIRISGSTTFSGYQIKPEVTKVECGDEVYTNINKSQITYGTNINAGKNAGSIKVNLNGNVVEKKFDINRRGVRLKIDDCEKELGGEIGSSALKCGENESSTFTWAIEDESISILREDLQKDSLNNFLKDLKEKIKFSVSDGVESVGTIFDITIDQSIKWSTLFPNYNFIVNKGEMLITKTKIHIVVSSTSKDYGKDDPEFKYQIYGNITSEDYGKLGSITLFRDPGEDVISGGYPIRVRIDDVEYEGKPSNVKDCQEPYCKETSDYYIYVVSGVLGICPIPATVTVDNFTKTYGDATPKFTYKVKGLLDNDELKDVTISCPNCSKTGLEGVGEYAVNAAVNVKSNPNYTVVTKSGKLTVTPKAATVTLDEATKTYGDKDPNYTYATEGLINGDVLKNAMITRTKGENVGSYDVNISFDEKDNPNYALTVVPSTLSITPKAVTLNVTNVTKKYGEKDPELIYSVDGIVTFGNEPDELKGVALMREAGEDAGEYVITAAVNAILNPNYIVSTTDGKLTITTNNDKIVVTIKGRSDTLQYDGKDHVVKGFDISTNNDAYALKFVEYTGDSAVSGKDAGKYAMGLSASDFKNTSINYANVTFNITDGLLVVNPRSLVVTANADTITYGDEIPTEFSWTADSLLDGDELGNIHLTFNETGLLNVGDYPLTFDQKDLSNKNYTVRKYVTNSLTVKPKLVTVKIADAEKIYSEADPDSFAYEISGLLEGDELSGIFVAREPGDTVRVDDTYSISATVENKNPNYLVKVEQGHFTVKPYTGKITVAIYGDALSASYTGKEITVTKSFDVSPMRIPGEEWLADSIAYKKEFVVYNGDLDMKVTEAGTYTMGLVASDFVNISPNFERVNFVVVYDGKLEIIDNMISLAAVKNAKTFGVTSMNRNIQVNGSTVGQHFAVLDLQGKVVRKGVVENSNFEIPVANSGIYMVRIGSLIQRVRVK